MANINPRLILDSTKKSYDEEKKRYIGIKKFQILCKMYFKIFLYDFYMILNVMFIHNETIKVKIRKKQMFFYSDNFSTKAYDISFTHFNRITLIVNRCIINWRLFIN